MALRSLVAWVAQNPQDWATPAQRQEAFKSAQNDAHALSIVIKDPTDTAVLYWENSKVFGPATLAEWVPFPAGGIIITEKKIGEISIISDINIDVRRSVIG